MTANKCLRACVRIFAVVLAGTTLFSNISYAQTDNVKSGLSIGPLRHELTIQRGSTGTIKLRLENISGADVTAKLQVNDFQSDNITGQPKIIIDEKREPASTSVKPFLVKTGNISLKKAEKKEVSINFEVPANAAPGGYYGLVRYTAEVPSTDPGAGSRVSLNASVGAIVLISVPGQITEGLKINKVSILRNDNPETLFFSAPDKIGLELQNLGNGFSRPAGRVSVSGGFGNKGEIFGYDVNNVEPRSNILPKTTRTFTNELKNVKRPGKYVVTASVAYDFGRETIVAKKTFWYFPMWFVVTFAVVALVVFGGIFWIWRKLQSGGGSHTRRRR